KKTAAGCGSPDGGMVNHDEGVVLSQGFYRKVRQILQGPPFPLDVHFRMIDVISISRRRQGRVTWSMVPGCSKESNHGEVSLGFTLPKLLTAATRKSIDKFPSPDEAVKEFRIFSLFHDSLQLLALSKTGTPILEQMT